MSGVNLAQAETIIDAALLKGRTLGLRPLTVAVLDPGGNLKALKREDGPGGPLRPQIAVGKAFAAVGLGQSSRALGEAAVERPHFVAALVGVSGGRVVPVPGGVTIEDASGLMLGAVGVTGDSSDNDEAAAIAGIEAAGLKPG